MQATERPRRKNPVDHDPRALRRARIRAGWQQNQLAHRLGLRSASTLCEAEKGTRGLSPKVRLELAKVLGCDPITFEPVDGASVEAPR